MAVLAYVTSTVESARRQADRVMPPDARQKAYDTTHAFALERPIVFSFLVAQALFSLLPVLLFISFVLGTLSLALTSALLFSLFWIGVAALILASTLFITSGLAVLAWAWLMGIYLAASFAYGLVVSGAAGTKPEEQRMLEGKWKNIAKTEPANAGVNGAAW
ncbi:unnamed protein product [Discula destructiva]